MHNIRFSPPNHLIFSLLPSSLPSYLQSITLITTSLFSVFYPHHFLLIFSLLPSSLPPYFQSITLITSTLFSVHYPHHFHLIFSLLPSYIPPYFQSITLTYSTLFSVYNPHYFYLIFSLQYYPHYFHYYPITTTPFFLINHLLLPPYFQCIPPITIPSFPFWILPYFQPFPLFITT